MNPHPLHRYVLAITCLVSTFHALPPARGSTISIDLPIEYASDSFAIRYQTPNGWYSLFGNPQDIFSGHYTPGGQTIPDDTSFIRFSTDTSGASGNFWIEDTTFGVDTGVPNVSWHPQLYFGWQSGVPTHHFAIDLTRYNHALVLVMKDALCTFPLTNATLGGWSEPDPNNPTGNSIIHYFGFFNAWAYTELAPNQNWGDFRLVDLTTHEEAPLNATNVVTAPWTTIGYDYPLASVTIYLGPGGETGSYTFHTSAGTLAGVVPSATNIYDEASDTWRTDYVVTQPAGWFQEFWLTRDDGAAFPHYPVGSTDVVISDASYYFPPVVSYWATLNFQVGQNYLASAQAGTLAMYRADGSKTYFYPDPTHPEGTSWLTTWDQNGQQIDFQFGYYAVDIQTYPSQGWWVVDESTGEGLDHAPVNLMAGWQPYNPAPPNGSIAVVLPTRLRQHALDGRLKLLSGAGIWNITIPPGYEWWSGGMYISYDMTTMGGLSGQWWVDYFIAYAPGNYGSGMSILDVVTGETSWTTDAATADFSLWYAPPNQLALALPASRWSHQLRLVQPLYAPADIQRGNLQGLWSMISVGESAFTGYGFFDASALHYPDLDYWIYDATTNEFLGPNQADAQSWTSATDSTDSDGDGLPDWYEFITGTSSSTADANSDGVPDGRDSDGDGFDDYYEIAHGWNPLRVTVRDTDGTRGVNLQVLTPLAAH